MKTNEGYEGYEVGEVCNRNGCQGIIKEHDTDSCCSCHTNPPCSHCTTSREYCDECEWDGRDEQLENDRISQEVHDRNKAYYEESNRKFKETRDDFYKRFNDKSPVETMDLRIESHTHFSQKVYGLYPEGTTNEEIVKRSKGSFGGRFELGPSDGRFIYIAYTD